MDIYYWTLIERLSPEEIDRMFVLLQFAGYKITETALYSNEVDKEKFPHICYFNDEVPRITLRRRFDSDTTEEYLTKEDLIKMIQKTIKNEPI